MCSARLGAIWLATVCVAGCGHDPIDEVDEVFHDWGERRVLCAAGLDTVSGNGDESLLSGLERAADTGEVVLYYGHKPGGTVSLERIEAVLSRAAELGLDFVTFADLAAGGPPRAAVSLSFDDAHVAAWYGARDLFAAYGARVTFFVTRFDRLSAEERGQLHELEALGHSIEAHGRRHLDAPRTVEERGLDAYLEEEALPSIEGLRDDGFDPVAFAYPFGLRTGELDDALLEHVRLVRAISFTFSSPLVSDPCPE